MIVVVFICILTGARLLWSSLFTEENDVSFTNGELDLRKWNPEETAVLSLDGEWLFYPNVFIEEEQGLHVLEGSPIQVPGNWDDYTKKGQADGYGSYRLRIFVDPNDEITYSIRVPSVRSSSELYVNGKKLAHVGNVGTDANTYVAGNKPFTVYFTAEDGVIDLVIHVANFDDSRGGGLIRSIKFGTEEALSIQTTLSITLQLITLIILLVNSLYAFILFILGNQDKRLLYFSLCTFSYTTLFAVSSDEKLLHLWFSIPYVFGFRLVTILMVVIAYTLLKCIEKHLPAFWQTVTKRSIIPVFISLVVILALPLKQMLVIQPIFILMMMISIAICLVTIFRISLEDINRSVLLLLSLTAFASNVIWWGVSIASGVKVTYYPFDIIIAVVLLAAFWFQHYFELHKKAHRMSEKLQETDKAKDAFLANTSHELRNPLHAVLNMSHAVLERERIGLQDESVKNLETVLSVGWRMSNMLDDLLDFAALKEQRVQLDPKSFPLQSIAYGVLDMVDLMIDGKPIQLMNEVPHDFPLIYADEDRTIQVLFNLVHNSVKYTNKGTISIHGNVKDGFAHIAVSDTGIGMTPKEIRAIFEPYEQAEGQETMVESGFGLGLSISKQFVELHGGELLVESSRGKGSTFTFSLPLATDEQLNDVLREVSATVADRIVVEKQIDLKSAMVRDEELPEERPHILVVDDDPVNLQVVETILSKENYAMTLVTGGEQALTKLHLREWDLVISDVMMPYMSGYTLTREIRDKFTLTELPVLLLTARSQLNDIENGFLSGANDYVAKPVDALELQARVRALTSLKRTMQEHVHMEAAWLQAQIQPHFLFNVLNTVIALSEIDPDRMRTLLEAFSTFLRRKFVFEEINELVSIEEEVELIEIYLFIEKERFADRLHVVWEIDPEAKQIHVPSLTIQPLVENAIHHGLMSQVEGGTITVRIRKEDGYVKVAVEDDGIGMKQKLAENLLSRKMNSTSSVGLINTHLRLQRQHGQGLKIDSEVGKGTVVSFCIPLNE